MKFLTYTLFLIFTINSFAQKNCKLNKKINEFDNMEITNTRLFNLASKGMADFVNVTLYKFKQNDEIKYSFYVSLNTGFKQCVTNDSYVSIKFKNGNIIKLPRNNSEIDCGTYSMFVDLELEQLRKISEEDIDMIRVNIEYQKDYKVKEKRDLKFNKIAECLLNE